MVERRVKGRRKLFSGWLRVFIARGSAHRPCTKQINRINGLVGASQWTKQKEVLLPVWTDSILDNCIGRRAID